MVLDDAINEVRIKHFFVHFLILSLFALAITVLICLLIERFAFTLF